VDRGEREIDGIQAHGYRWWRASAANGDYTEQWVSDNDLGVDLLRIEMDQTRGEERQAKLVDIMRDISLDDPVRKWFKIPKGVPKDHIQIHDDAALPPLSNAPDDRSTLHGLSSCWHSWLRQIDVGLLKGSPFTAEEKITYWQTLPAGEKHPALRAGWRISPDGTKQISTDPWPNRIARDDAGRVSIKFPRGTTSVSPDAQESGWDEQMCDPAAETVSWGGDLNGPRVGPIEMLYSPFWWRSPRRQWIDLGYQEIDALRAHGYRWWDTTNNNLMDTNGDFSELWVSEELKLDLVYTVTNKTKGNGSRSELVNLRRQEPDPKVFEQP
jgi:hypothetical protein